MIDPTTNFSYFKVVVRSKRPFLIRSMLREDIEPCVELMTTCHENFHPIMMCLKFNKEIYMELLRRRIESVIDEDMCVVCVDIQTKKLAGVCLGSDCKPKKTVNSDDLYEKYPEMKCYLEILRIFNSKYPEYCNLYGPVMKRFQGNRLFSFAIRTSSSKRIFFALVIILALL